MSVPAPARLALALAGGLLAVLAAVALSCALGAQPISLRAALAGRDPDAAILLGALTGLDPRDPQTSAGADKAYSDYTRFLDPHGLAGARIGVARGFFGFHDQVDKVMEGALAVLKDLGAVLVDPADIATTRMYENADLEALLYEFKADLNQYLGALGKDAAVHSLQELIAFNKANQGREMPYFGQELFHRAQEKGDLSSPEYAQVRERVQRLARDEGVDATLDKHRLDALVAPTEGPAWLTDWINGDHCLGGSSSAAARAGYPSITVPAGFIHGLPVGLSFFSRAFSEPLLLKLAYAFEQATRQRRPPQFLSRAVLA